MPKTLIFITHSLTHSHSSRLQNQTSFRSVCVFRQQFNEEMSSSESEKKQQLVLVIEGNAALGPYWRTILSDYVLKIIRSFCGDEAMEAASPNVELALVTFNAHGSYSSCLVQQSSWTRSVDYFLEWLSAMHFSGGGFCDAAIAEGLSQVLMMCPFQNVSQTPKNEGFQRHCILVSASNPYPLPTAVYLPPDKNQMQSQISLSDAETVAKSFPRSCVSLSVICPRQLPKLRAIYNAGKRNPSAADPTVNIVKNPHYLVLISENFREACAALCSTEITTFPSNQSLSETEVTSVPPVSEPPPTSVSPGNESLTNQQSVSVGNIPLATVKVEPSTVSSLTSTQASQTCLPLSASQEMLSSNDNVQDVKPVVSSLQTSLMNPTVLPGGTPTGQLSIDGNPMANNMSNVISEGTTSSVPAAQTVNISGEVSVTSMAESTTLAGTGQVAPQSVGVNNNMATNTSLSQQTSSAPESGRSKYVKVWEGDLLGNKRGEDVFIVRLEAYQSSSDPPLLVEDWPSKMRIERLISRDHMNNKKHAGKAQCVFFRALNQHGFLGQLTEKKLCTVIKLPSQMMLLTTVSDKEGRLLGMMFPGDMVSLKPRVSGQQQQQQRAGTRMNQEQVPSPQPKQEQ